MSLQGILLANNCTISHCLMGENSLADEKERNANEAFGEGIDTWQAPYFKSRSHSLIPSGNSTLNLSPSSLVSWLNLSQRYDNSFKDVLWEPHSSGLWMGSLDVLQTPWQLPCFQQLHV